VAEHNYWMPSKIATYLIAVLNEPAGHILNMASLLEQHMMRLLRCSRMAVVTATYKCSTLN
jgi:hypothetical protein